MENTIKEYRTLVSKFPYVEDLMRLFDDAGAMTLGEILAASTELIDHYPSLEILDNNRLYKRLNALSDVGVLEQVGTLGRARVFNTTSLWDDLKASMGIGETDDSDEVGPDTSEAELPVGEGDCVEEQDDVELKPEPLVIEDELGTSDLHQSLIFRSPVPDSVFSERPTPKTNGLVETVVRIKGVEHTEQSLEHLRSARDAVLSIQGYRDHFIESGVSIGIASRDEVPVHFSHDEIVELVLQLR